MKTCEEKFAALCRTADGGVKPLRRKDGHLAEDHALEQAYASRKALERAPGIHLARVRAVPRAQKRSPGSERSPRMRARRYGNVQSVLHLRRSHTFRNEGACDGCTVLSGCPFFFGELLDPAIVLSA